MPQTQDPEKVPIPICSAILTLHYFQEKSFREISKLLPVSADTAEQIWNKAKSCAADPGGIRDMLKTLGSERQSSSEGA
ncbi:hypothetical protein Q9L58_000282 [Maublancomyces gigas]|uniref:RNA polymerase sigma factor 70 region 4 type 2 domain-containing protein n=1 Tax=Discina gigas TaxID=1032678 RepID=A0ABR3GYD8_9PEZI